MGIKNLNKFIREKCQNSIKCISIADLRDKTIAVDISIYIYKYHTEEMLLENIYLMITIFRHYGANPIFVFDGKPPTEKKALLAQRKIDKVSAKNEFNKLKEQLHLDKDISEQDRQEIVSSMDVLKKQFVSIKKEQIEGVKSLIHACGMNWIDAPGEADQMCAYMVQENSAWACMSDDMDMFVYGMDRVLRYFSLMNHTAVLYDMQSILKELDLSQKEFQQICILSGTDYNQETSLSWSSSSLSLYEIYNNFRIYKKKEIEVQETNNDFYSWIIQMYPNSKINYENLVQIQQLFETKDLYLGVGVGDISKTLNKTNAKPLEMNKIKALLEPEGFFF